MGTSSSSSAPSSNPLGACAAGGQKKQQITFEPKTRAPMPRLSDCHAAIEEGHHAFRQKLRRLLVVVQTGEIHRRSSGTLISLCRNRSSID